MFLKSMSCDPDIQISDLGLILIQIAAKVCTLSFSTLRCRQQKLFVLRSYSVTWASFAPGQSHNMPNFVPIKTSIKLRERITHIVHIFHHIAKGKHLSYLVRYKLRERITHIVHIFYHIANGKHLSYA